MNFKSESMTLNFAGSVAYLTFKGLEKYDFLSHAFSTRLGGVSKNEFESMNLSHSVPDIAWNVEKNHEIFCSALNYNRNFLVSGKQVHGNKIKVITSNDVKNHNLKFEGFDGFITNIPRVVLETFHADCCPVYMLDPKLRVVGLAHAGWRGTVSKIAENLAENFVSNFGSDKEDIICALGPAIGECCFEVLSDVKNEFENLNLKMDFKKIGDKFSIDLEEVNRQILINYGIAPENIFKSDVCTSCNHELLFSHRFSGGKRGNNAAFISIIK